MSEEESVVVLSTSLQDSVTVPLYMPEKDMQVKSDKKCTLEEGAQLQLSDL
jgi:hypothetical protein